MLIDCKVFTYRSKEIILLPKQTVAFLPKQTVTLTLLPISAAALGMAESTSQSKRMKVRNMF
jgi:hypothetical protein